MLSGMLGRHRILGQVATAPRPPCRSTCRVPPKPSARCSAAAAAARQSDRGFQLYISGAPTSYLPSTCMVPDPLCVEGELMATPLEALPTGMLRQERLHELSVQARAEARELRASLEVSQHELSQLKAQLEAERASRQEMQRHYQTVVAAKDVQMQQLFHIASQSERERAAMQSDLTELRGDIAQLKAALQQRLAAVAGEERRQKQQQQQAIHMLSELHALSRSLVEESRREDANRAAGTSSNGNGAKSSQNGHAPKGSSHSSNGAAKLVVAAYSEAPQQHKGPLAKLYGRPGSTDAANRK